ncbi:MAG TPA: hypothetical protein VF532_07555 [Candidatus Angelobacter sp.]
MQIQHGTVVVIFYSRDRVVLAADSRVTDSGPGGPHQDNQCKVSDLGHETIFAASGFTRYNFGQDQRMPAFDVFREAATVSRSLKAGAPDRARVLAENWGRNVKDALDAGLARHPREVMTLLHGKSTQLAGAIFAARDAEGLVVYYVTLRCECQGSRKYSSLHITKMKPVEDGMPAASLGTSETMELFSEVADGSSARGVAERDGWIAAATKPDRDVYVTIRTGEFILRNSKDHTVAGPINALELTAQGQVRWVKRESNCR